MPDMPRDVGQAFQPDRQAGKPDLRPPLDSSRSALEFIHRLLILPAEEQTNLSGLLEELSSAFAVSGAGLATFPEGVPLSFYPTLPPESLSSASLPWHEQPDLIERLFPERGSLTAPRRAGGSCLITILGTPERGGWLLWLEHGERMEWSESEGSLLVMAGHALTRRLTREESLPPWAAQLDRAIRQRRMDASARIVRRLAHDFGNILTGILGFSELSLAHQLAPSSPLHAYLTEIHRGAQNGAQYTNQLRLFARRQTTLIALLQPGCRAGRGRNAVESCSGRGRGSSAWMCLRTSLPSRSRRSRCGRRWRSCWTTHARRSPAPASSTSRRGSCR